jgi:hypothetical protein
LPEALTNSSMEETISNLRMKIVKECGRTMISTYFLAPLGGWCSAWWNVRDLLDLVSFFGPA